MTHRMACCCGDGGGGPSGCDLEALCVEVEFNGINIADFFAAWQAECGDPDCDDDLPAVLAAWGFNTVFRGHLADGPFETCEAGTVVRRRIPSSWRFMPGSKQATRPSRPRAPITLISAAKGTTPSRMQGTAKASSAAAPSGTVPMRAWPLPS